MTAADRDQFHWDGAAWLWWDGQVWIPVGPDTPQPHTPQDAAVSVKRKPGWALPVVGVGLFVIAIGSCSAMMSTSADADPAPHVKVACRDWVKDRLKSPSTAEFSGESVTGSGSTFTVYGAVDSQNGFGAMVRSTYTCKTTHAGDSTKLVSVNIH